MGHKVNPKIFRISVNDNWNSKWFASGKNYVVKLEEDIRLRKFLMKRLKEVGVDKVEILRNANKTTVNIWSSKPGMIIGRGGTGVEDLKKEIRVKILKTVRPADVNLNIMEVSRPNLSAQIVLQSMISDIEKRMPFRRVLKQTLSRVEKAGALGVKVMVKGRLNGAEIAREEKLTWGKVPLHTLRADIDYARGAAHTTYGVIGVRTWIYKGDVFKE